MSAGLALRLILFIKSNAKILPTYQCDDRTIDKWGVFNFSAIIHFSSSEVIFGSLRKSDFRISVFRISVVGFNISEEHLRKSDFRNIHFRNIQRQSAEHFIFSVFISGLIVINRPSLANQVFLAYPIKGTDQRSRQISLRPSNNNTNNTGRTLIIRLPVRSKVSTV